MMKQIRLELARDKEFPSGSREHGYDFAAPIDDEGHIDADGWHKDRAKCRVRRFWKGEEDEIGHLVRKPGGSWAFHYDIHGNEDDDESGYRFAIHCFKPGEYVSLREHDGEMRTFVVARVAEL